MKNARLIIFIISLSALVLWTGCWAFGLLQEGIAGVQDAQSALFFEGFGFFAFICLLVKENGCTCQQHAGPVQKPIESTQTIP